MTALHHATLSHFLFMIATNVALKFETVRMRTGTERSAMLRDRLPPLPRAALLPRKKEPMNIDPQSRMKIDAELLL